jgi:hypothetical protein
MVECIYPFSGDTIYQPEGYCINHISTTPLERKSYGSTAVHLKIFLCSNVMLSTFLSRQFYLRLCIYTYGFLAIHDSCQWIPHPCCLFHVSTPMAPHVSSQAHHFLTLFLARIHSVQLFSFHPCPIFLTLFHTMDTPALAHEISSNSIP